MWGAVKTLQVPATAALVATAGKAQWSRRDKADSSPTWRLHQTCVSAATHDTKPRLAAIDLDGTLLRNDGSVTSRTRAALQNFQSMPGSCGVVLATGQPPSQLLRNLKVIGLEGCGYCIASNGATVVWAPTGKVVHQEVVSAAALVRLIPQIRALMSELRLTIESESGWITSNMDFFSMLDKLMPGTGTKLSKIGKEQPLLEEALSSKAGDGKITEAVRLLMLSADDSKGSTARLMERLAPLVERENAKYGSGLSLGSPGGGEGAVHITPAGVDKAKALTWVCEQLGVGPESVIAFGDHINDNGMLSFAGRGVAMGNAVEETKRLADEVTASNEEDGVAVVLERIAGLRGKL